MTFNSKAKKYTKISIKWQKIISKMAKNHYLIRASMVLVNFFGNNIRDVPGGFENFM